MANYQDTVSAVMKKEISRFFLPDGAINEGAFTAVFKARLDDLRSGKSDEEFQRAATEWIISYIDEVMHYLHAKNMKDSSYAFIRTVIDRSAAFGIEKVNIPAALIQDVFTSLPAVKPDHKNATSNQKKKSIFQAALKVFGEMGFHKATMDMIAQISGLGKGTLYRIFESKEELLEQLMNEEYRKIVANIAAIFTKDGDILSEIRQMIEYWVSYINENPVVYRLILAEDVTGGINGKARFYRHMNEQLPLVRVKLGALYGENVVKDVDFDTLFYGIFGFIDGVFHKWSSMGMKYALTREIPVILECVFNGFLSEECPREHFHMPIIAHDVANLSGEG